MAAPAGLCQGEGLSLGVVFLDGTKIRTHHKAAGAEERGSGPERDEREALGRSRGGYGTKACMICEANDRPIAFRLVTGQAHGLPQAGGLLADLPRALQWLVADKGYAAHGFHEAIGGMASRTAIPTKSNEAPVDCPAWIYNNRHQIENAWTRLKEWRAVAARYEKTTTSFIGVLCIAAACPWIKS